MNHELVVFVIRALLIHTSHLIAEVKKAKGDDGKVSLDELPGIAVNSILKTLDSMDLGGEKGSEQ